MYIIINAGVNEIFVVNNELVCSITQIKKYCKNVEI